MLPCELNPLDGCFRPVDAPRYGEDGFLPGRRVDDAVDRLPIRARNDEVGHVLEEEVHRSIGVGLIIPFQAQVEIVRQIGFEERVVTCRRQRADTLPCADIQHRPQIVEARAGHGARRVEPQVQAVGQFQLHVQRGQEVGIAAAFGHGLRVREIDRQERRVSGAGRDRKWNAADPARNHLDDFLARAGIEVEGHAGNVSLEIDADIGRPVLFGDPLDSAGVKREVERAIEARAAARIIARRVGPLPESFQITLIGARVIFEQHRREITGEAGQPVLGADRAVDQAGRDGHASIAARRCAIARISLPEIIGEGVAVFEGEFILHIAAAQLDRQIILLPGRAEAELLDLVTVELLLADSDVRSDDRLIGPGRFIAGRAIGGELREATAAVAIDPNAQGRADQAAIADVAIFVADLAIGIEPAFGIAGVGVDLEIFRRVPFDVQADLVGFQNGGFRTCGEVGRRSGLQEIDGGPIAVLLHIAQVALVEPDTEAGNIRDDLLPRIIVVNREHHIVGRLPLEGDTTVDALILGIALIGAILLRIPTDNVARQSQLLIRANRRPLAIPVKPALPARNIHTVGLRVAAGIDRIDQDPHRVVGEGGAEQAADGRHDLARFILHRSGRRESHAGARLVEGLGVGDIERRADRTAGQRHFGRLVDSQLSDKVRAYGGEIDRTTARRGRQAPPIDERFVEVAAKAAHRNTLRFAA